MTNRTALYWLKRDFRLADNPALTTALTENEAVTLLYIIEDEFLEAPETSAFHVHAITGALADLRKSLKAFRADILVMHGEVVSCLQKLCSAQHFTKLYSHEEIGVDRTYQRDLRVADWCKSNNVHWSEHRQTGVFRRLSSRDERSKLWKKFTLGELLPVPSTDELSKITIPTAYKKLKLSLGVQKSFWTSTYQLSKEQQSAVQDVSETAANATLQSFLYERGIMYRGGISSPNSAFSAGSRLSVHLAWGTLTGRMAYQATQARKEELKESNHPDAGKWRQSLTSFLSRLHWRDHFIQRLETEPQMAQVPLNLAYADLEYIDDPERLEAWIEGRTGFPLVDACIRCMRTTGFINFRMRAMLTSVACHSLQIDWRKIDHPMARMYTDYEPGIHLSQLQMQASVVGINSIRIYSPNKQIIDQDPEAVFIKQWVPELRNFTPKQIIEHRSEPLGDYPGQLVDYWSSSREMKDKLWTIRKLSETKKISQQVYYKHGSRKGPSSRKKKPASDVKA